MSQAVRAELLGRGWGIHAGLELHPPGTSWILLARHEVLLDAVPLERVPLLLVSEDFPFGDDYGVYLESSYRRHIAWPYLSVRMELGL